MNKFHFQSEFIEQKNVSAAFSDNLQNGAVKIGKPRILMVGMHLTKTRGGISTLIAEILKSGLKDEFEFVYIESQAEDFGKNDKALLAFHAVWRFLFNCVWKRPALVYVHLGSNASLYRESVFILLGKVLRQKIVAHFHAGDIDNYYPFQHRLGQKFIRLAIGSCDSIIAVSQESARQLQNIAGALKISVIPNAIDASVFCANDNLPKDKNGATRLLFVGAVGKLKGERDLIKALAILRDGDEPNIKVSFLGYGAESLKDYCVELGVVDYVEHLGAVSMSERVEFFQKADIFVLPTYAEAMPMSVIEAMAAGLATITTPVGGIPELIEDGADGFLFPPGDAKALAEKISFLLNNKDLINKIGAKARKKAVEQFNFPQYAGKLRSHLLAECSPKTKI